MQTLTHTNLIFPLTLTTIYTHTHIVPLSMLKTRENGV